MMIVLTKSRQLLFHTYFQKEYLQHHFRLTRCFMLEDYFSAEDFQDTGNKPLRNIDHKKDGRTGVHQRHRMNKPLQEYLCGRSVCQIALEYSKRPIFQLYASKKWQNTFPDDENISSILYKAAKRHIPIKYIPNTSLFDMSDGRPHQGVCLEVGRFVPFQADLTAMLADPAPNRLPLWVLLDGVKDPMNVGAILRTCHFLDVDKVLLSPQCASITSTVSKASSGASEIIPIYSVHDSTQFVQGLLAANWDVVGTDALQENDIEADDNEIQYSDNNLSNNSIKPSNLCNFKVSKPTILVLGSEGFGISEDIKSSFTKLLSIQSNRDDAAVVSCLNVSAAAAILLYKLIENR